MDICNQKITYLTHEKKIDVIKEQNSTFETNDTIVKQMSLIIAMYVITFNLKGNMKLSKAI